VWRGATAQEALGHAKRHVLDLASIEREFLAAVKQQAARTRQRKFLAIAAIVTALVLVFAGGAVALLRIKQAEKLAQDKAAQAEQDRGAAVAAKSALQDKVEALEAEKKARESAEAEKKSMAQDLEANKELSKEQLEAANQELQRRVVEAQAAKDKALANEAIARKATEEAKAAKIVVDKLLAEKAAELARLKKATEGIATSLDSKHAAPAPEAKKP
jgi:hypothetical protein